MLNDVPSSKSKSRASRQQRARSSLAAGTMTGSAFLGAPDSQCDVQEGTTAWIPPKAAPVPMT